jgi:hypothetical protein
MSKDWCESGHSVENDTAKKDKHYEGSPTRVKPEPQGTSEIELALAKLVGYLKNFAY